MKPRRGQTFAQVAQVASSNAMARALASATSRGELSFADPGDPASAWRHSVIVFSHLGCFKPRSHSPTRSSVACGITLHSPEVIRPSGEAKHAIRAIGESIVVAPSKVVNARTLTAPRGAIDASVNLASQGSRATHGRATAYRRFVGEGV